MKKVITFLAFALIANISLATITFTPTAIDTGYCQHYYNCKVTATGGTAPYKYAISTGTLPAGLYMSKVTGRINGTITLTNDTSVAFTVRAIDAANDTAFKSYTMYIQNKVLTWSELTNIWSLQPNTFPTHAEVYDTYRLPAENLTNISDSIVTLSESITTLSESIAEISAPLSATLTLDSTQIRSLYSSPQDIVDAPGAGKYIEVISASAIIETYSGTSYGTNTIIALKSTGATIYLMRDQKILPSSVARIVRFEGVEAGGASDTQIITNTALQVYVTGGNPTCAGTGSTIKIKVLYRIVTI